MLIWWYLPFSQRTFVDFWTARIFWLFVILENLSFTQTRGGYTEPHFSLFLSDFCSLLLCNGVLCNSSLLSLNSTPAEEFKLYAPALHFGFSSIFIVESQLSKEILYSIIFCFRFHFLILFRFDFFLSACWENRGKWKKWFLDFCVYRRLIVNCTS